MHRNDPKQAIIETISPRAIQLKRGERGVPVTSEEIFFLKEKDHLHAHAYVVRYMDITGQVVYETYCTGQSTDGSYSTTIFVGCKAEARFQMYGEEQAKYQHQPWLNVTGGEISKTSAIQLEEDAYGYRFVVGYLNTNGHDVATVRMIPHIGLVDEDTVQDNTVLFLGKFVPPITFEFFSPSQNLIATQCWSA